MRSVVIVDDHASFRRQARRMLEAGGYEVVGEAANGRSAIQQVERFRPSLVLLDVTLPDISGFELAARFDSSTVVLTSGRDLASSRRRLAESGVIGFIPKEQLSAAALDRLLEDT
jgi:two-component system chemotaxis response regulator CheY